MDIQPSVYTRLSSLRSNDDAAKLFSSILNYEYSGKTLPIKQFPSSLDGRITRLQVLAGYDDFKVLHCEVDQLLLGVERPIINSLLKDHPYSLFLFSDSKKSAWHFINVKYDEEESRRRVFRRIVVGPDERLHTAAQRIAMLEIPDERKLSPLELQELHDKAFDVEAVTKEFFRSFATMFGIVKEEIEELNPRYKAKAGEFAQMLLDRLMFLYFIQKKGWLNNQGNYLFDRFRKGFKDQPEKHNYYTDVILRVFQRLAFADLQYKDLGNLPFLNGGLFEIDLWESSLKISNGLFGKLFKDLFEHYNFTVREDTAMDMEVAIDPEMLGKVFENLVLLQEKDPTTDLRKATGSYYTPRVIVHFMSEQSLKEYLIENAYEEGLRQQIREKIEKLFTLNPAGQLTDDELAWLRNSFTTEETQRLRDHILKCRVCDPAVGSGAFVVGMLHVMIAIIKLLDVGLRGRDEIRKRNYDYELKRKIIEHCLYGVDIQEQAVRICELRLWLSLVVDYDAAGGDVPPLPNLSYRIRRGNSLIDQLFGYNVNLSLKAGFSGGEKLKQLVDSIQNDKLAYFYEPDIEKKRRAEVGIIAKQCDIATHYLRLRHDQVLGEFEAKYSKGLFGDRTIKKTEEEEKLSIKQEMKELERLTLHVKQTKDKLTKGMTWGKRSLDEIKEAFGFTFAWSLDFAEVFKDRSGFDVIIGNPPYLFGEYLAENKELYSQLYDLARSQFDAYWLFYERDLRHVLRPRGIHCFINSDAMLARDDTTMLRRWILKRVDAPTMSHVGQVFEKVGVSAVVVMLREGQRTVEHYTIVPYDIKTHTFGIPRNSSMGQILNDPKMRMITQVSAGWTSKLKSTKDMGNYFEICRGEELGKSSLLRITGEHTKHGYSKIVSGEGVERYIQPVPTHFVRTTDVVKSKTNYRPPKIVLVKTGKSFVAAVDASGCLTLQSVYNIHPKGNLSCAVGCALLNSAPLNLFLAEKVTNQKKLFPQITQGNVLEMPVPELSENDIKALENLVATIRKEGGVDVSDAIASIDNIVLRAFGLAKADLFNTIQSDQTGRKD